MPCWSCGAAVPEAAAYCPACGHSLTQRDSLPIFVVDATTELFNAVFIKAVVEQETTRALRHSRPLSLLLVELDHGAAISADLGPAQLGRLLKELAQSVVASVRDTDTVAFLGAGPPPRFAVVLPETDEAGSVVAADKVRREVASCDYPSGGPWQRLTVSVGATTLSHERMGHQDLIQQAREVLESGQSEGVGPNHTFLPAGA